MTANRKRWQFGIRDVILWTSVVCLAGGWINDHWTSIRKLQDQRAQYEAQLERLRESIDRLTREIKNIKPHSWAAARHVFPTNTKCASCGESAAARPADEMWYTWGESHELQYFGRCAGDVALKAATR